MSAVPKTCSKAGCNAGPWMTLYDYRRHRFLIHGEPYPTDSNPMTDGLIESLVSRLEILEKKQMNLICDQCSVNSAHPAFNTEAEFKQHQRTAHGQKFPEDDVLYPLLDRQSRPVSQGRPGPQSRPGPIRYDSHGHPISDDESFLIVWTDPNNGTPHYANRGYTNKSPVDWPTSKTQAEVVSRETAESFAANQVHISIEAV